MMIDLETDVERYRVVPWGYDTGLRGLDFYIQVLPGFNKVFVDLIHRTMSEPVEVYWRDSIRAKRRHSWACESYVSSLDVDGKLHLVSTGRPERLDFLD